MYQETHRLMTVSEAADALRLSRNTINNWLSQQRLRRIKIGGRTFIARTEVESMLEKAMKDGR
tara:strand:- start:432 stop:620 length:189 start_codon:yes stop_codon:yes gene_type:complete